MVGSAAFVSSSSTRSLFSFGGARSLRRPCSSSPSPSSVPIHLSNSLPSSSTKVGSSTLPPPSQQPLPKDWELQHRTLLVDAFHRNNDLRALLHEVSAGTNAAQLLARDGDWPDDHLWAVVAFLSEPGRAEEALQVFDFWKNIELTRNSISNYSRIIKLFCGEGLMSEAISAFQAMQKCGLAPSLAIYNTIIHGFARQGNFDNSIATITMMFEAGLSPTPDTYNGLIRAYGTFGQYDEMSKCVKRMESSGCFPDEGTYNILIAELARAGLLEKMERVYRTLSSKHMKLRTTTLLAMLEGYADLGILDKMEKAFRRILNTKAFIKENLMRKIALVYIKNYRFAHLEDLANDVSAKWGRTDLVWYILLLSSVCLLSKKGVESIVREMEVAKVTANITTTNILAHFYLKMRDFKSLDIVFNEARVNNIKPDIMTFGVFFDSCKIGYDGTHVLDKWRKSGCLEEVVELRTDNLVHTALGKGSFLKLSEQLYSSLHSKEKQKKLWRYRDLISIVFGKKAKRKE